MSALPKDAKDVWAILPMQVALLPQVLEIERRAYEFPWTETIFKDCLKSGYSAWVLAGDDGRLAGYALMSMAVDEAHVLNLCIDPFQQRRGFGLKLLKHLMKIARAAQASIVLLEVRKSNKAALKLYEGIGFARIGVRKAYYPAAGGREDALVLGFDIL
ncbi:ribosomal protein S18-alanine N-acetyltransferase [uncultured Nevskia sp.]|uniref:ribosomal protein S18-alanine N-acetyltransferase n=1 Tax=uncultured Nevskia sp. TaxID=228950 RepID=UPI0025D91774|nr:ribosomal protein S18-alanine N-acetyltransferase [uncultured Nevskia sp.]